MSETGQGISVLEREATNKRDFWLSSGHMLLDENDSGGLLLTDSFLKAYLARPELMPPPEACDAERALHEKLMTNPRDAVAQAELEAIADEDARENWKVMLSFRALLLEAPTLEAAYLKIVHGKAPRTPPLFVNQLVHVIARQAFTDCTDPFVLRAAELFFRPQRMTVHNGAVMLADEEVIGVQQKRIETSPLLAMFAGETAQMDILALENASRYWERSDQFDFILEFGTLEGGRRAFAKAISIWVRHLLGFELEIEPIARIEDQSVRWLMGLDTEATRLGNAVWNSEELEPADAGRLLAFFRIAPAAGLPFEDRVRGYPIYLLLAMDDDRIVRVKPQNLIAGLPLVVQF